MIFLRQHFVTSLDFFVVPILFIIITCLGYLYSGRRIKKPEIRRYFRYGLLFKLSGSILLGLITQYYFGGGDTYYYFKGASSFTRNFFTDFPTTMKLLWNDAQFISSYGYKYSYFTGIRALLDSDSALLIMKIGGLMGLFTLNTYLGTALIFALFAFLGSWKIFRVFYDLYPSLHRQAAMATLFIPSVLFWGSGFLKDPIVMGALGFMFYSSYMLFFKKGNKLKYTIILIGSSYLIIQIKVYIFLAFFPALAFWLTMNFKNKIRNKVLRLLSMPLLVVLSVIIGYFGFNKLTSMERFKEFSFELAAEKASEMVDYYDKTNSRQAARGQGTMSNFSIGAFEPTPIGMLKKFPSAIGATLYRPYIWEVKKIVNLPAAIESTLFLLFTIWVILKKKLIFFFPEILSNSTTLFCLIFTLIFAFVVGISTANFGTLVRYKIPCLPFFLMAMFIINNPKELSKQR